MSAPIESGQLTTIKFADGFSQEIDLLVLVNEQAQRFLLKVGAATATGCTEWLAGRGQDGYGKFQLTLPFVPGNGRTHNRQLHLRASRMAFMVHYHRVPVGVMRHTCDNPPCANPLHLLEGTQKQNRQDCVQRGRQPHGSGHGRAVLNEQQVLEIRAARERGENLSALADHLGVKRITVHMAASGRTWKYL